MSQRSTCTSIPSPIPKHLSRKLAAPVALRSRLLPFTHWTLRVREQCYEVTSIDSQPWLGNPPVYDIKVSPSWRWDRLRDGYGISHERFKIGLTVWSDDDILAYGRIYLFGTSSG